MFPTRFSILTNDQLLQLVGIAYAAIKGRVGHEEALSIANYVVAVCVATWDRKPEDAPQTQEHRKFYVRVAARHEAGRIGKRQPRTVELADPDALPCSREPDPGDAAFLAELERGVYEVIRTALAGLSEGDRNLLLARSAGLSYRDTVGRLKFRPDTEATVRKRTQRALERLERGVRDARLPPESSVLLALHATTIWERLRAEFGFAA